MMPQVSLALITYNKLQYLRGTLLALQLLEYPRLDFEVVVVDDGSTDGTTAFLKEFEPDYTLRWMRQRNSGRARSRNASIEMTEGELVVILDDDFLMHPRSLNHLWSAYQKHPRDILISSLNHIGVSNVQSLLEQIVRDETVPWDRLDDYAPAENEYALADLRRRMLAYGIERFAVPWVAAQGMSVTIPKHVCERLGGYDGRFGAYGMEDFDLAYRFFEQRGRFRWVANSVLYHLDHGHDRTVLFKESTITTRQFFDKFHDKTEIRQFTKFLCGAVNFDELNNLVAKSRGHEPIEGFNLRFSPYGMIRYRDRQLGNRDKAMMSAVQYTKAQEFRLRFLLERVGRDLQREGTTGRALKPFLPCGGQSVLVIAPHMDDEVIGCGGLIYQLAKRGSTVTVLFLSDGATRNLPCGEYGKLCHERRAESERAADILGVERCSYLGIPERNLADASKDPTPLVRALHEYRPDVVLVPGEFEHHPDHRVANRWLREALRVQPIPTEILSYEVWGCSRPTDILVLDEETWRRKTDALEEYQTQLRVLNYKQLMAYVNETRGKQHLNRNCNARAEAYRRISVSGGVL